MSKLEDAIRDLRNNSITILDLTDEEIGDAGAYDLAEALQVSQALTNLNLTNNAIGDVGAHDLAEALKVNQVLTTLRLEGNAIGGVGAHDLAEALKVNQVLTELNLEGNAIGDVGIRELTEVLKINQSITTVQINNINIVPVERQRGALEEEVRVAAVEAARVEAEGVAALEVARVEAEGVAALEVARVEAERVAAVEVARVEVERVAAVEVARVEAERVAALEVARVEAERIAAANAASVEVERAAAIDLEVLRDINELVREGNDKIQQHVDKAILLLGKTGSGKSTMANVLDGRELQAMLDDRLGDMVIDAINPLKDIIISHNKVAETKIPNKCSVGDIVIWDCPGFQDTRGIAQEIANGFYIKKLFETTTNLKFVLVVPDSSLVHNRGIDFVDTVKQLIRTFTDVSIIRGSISLVVTQAPSSKTSVHINNSIKLIIEQNKFLAPEIYVMLQDLLDSVHVFHKPTAEGRLDIGYDFLEAINSSTKYISNISDYARLSVSNASKEYVPDLLKTAQTNFTEIANIVLRAVAESNGCIVDQNNSLTRSWEIVQKLLPSGQIMYLPLERLPEHKHEHFVGIEALSKLYAAVNAKVDYSGGSLSFLSNILQTFEEYIVSDQKQVLKMQMQEYIYILNQQMEYIKFFSQVCGKEILDYLEGLNRPIESCKAAIAANLLEATRSMTLEDQQSPEYYKTAIKYLEIYNDQEWSIKTQAKAYMHLGDLSVFYERLDEAVSYYIRTIQLDKTLPMTYIKVGDLLFKTGEYKTAIDCYKPVNNHLKIETCFKKLLELTPESAEQHMVAADYFASIGRYEKATKLYNNAFSLSQDNGVKASAWHKISHILDGSQERAAKLAERAAAEDFYDLDSAESLAHLLGNHVHQDHIDAE